MAATPKKAQAKQAGVPKQATDRDVLKQATNKEIPWAEVVKQMHEETDKYIEEKLNSSEVWYI